VEPFPALIVENDIVYGTGGGRDLMLDILRPDLPLEPARPLVIWVHGGGWVGGNRSPSPNGPLARQGFVTASVSYRFSDEAIFPAQIHDVKAAIRFLRANAARWGIDAARIGIWGHSAGGHLAALAATTNSIDAVEGEGGNPGVDSSIQAAVPLSPPTDFLVDWFAESDFPRHEDALDVVNQLFGGFDLDDPASRDLARQASPVHHTSSDDPPVLVVHGTLDDVVPVQQGRALVRAMQEHGADVSLMELPHDDHALVSVYGSMWEEPESEPTLAMREIVEFFDRVLGPVG
jgi:acetyl esterase/lipase